MSKRAVLVLERAIPKEVLVSEECDDGAVLLTVAIEHEHEHEQEHEHEHEQEHEQEHEVALALLSRMLLGEGANGITKVEAKIGNVQKKRISWDRGLLVVHSIIMLELYIRFLR